jgi:signal transduction histidine kinase
MGSAAESAVPQGTPLDEGQPPGFPFRGPGLLARAVPFAVVAVLAEVSLALPPSVQSWPAVIASIVLLVAVFASFALPWQRLPAWMTVLVPLACAGWVLALILAAGATSGLGIVALVPLVWAALFHRRWESWCVVAAVVAVEVITSLMPTAEADAVIIRRVLLWGLLGTLISVANHGLRDRLARSHLESAALQEQRREMSVLQDRERIAAGLQDQVIQGIFAAGLDLESAASMTTQAAVRQRAEAAAGELDEVLRLLRDTVFGLEQRLRGRGLRQEIVALCDGLSPAPEVSFTGPVDGALQPGGGTRLAGMLREALAVIGQHAVPSRIGVTAGQDACMTVLEAVPLPHAAGSDWAARETAGLQEQAQQAGASVEIGAIPGGVRFAWRLPLAGTGAFRPQAAP